VEANNITFTALIDTGSKYNFVIDTTFKNLNKPKKSECNIYLFGFGKSDQNKIKPSGSFEITIDDEHFITKFLVVESQYLDKEIVLGEEFCTLAQLTIFSEGVKVTKPTSAVADISSIYKIDTEDCNKIVTDSEPTASAKAKEVVHNVVQNYQAVSTKSTIHLRPSRFSYSERCIIDKQTDQWLKDGVIETSESEYSSPVVLVNKRNGSHRICIDYRRINKVIIRDHFPLPLIGDQLDRLQT